MQEKCVLIYDDDDEIRRICKLILSDEYQQVEAFASCENIIEDIRKVNPGIILMDLWMPIMDGEHAVKYLHENENTKHIPVVVFSAVNDIEKISKRIEADALLKKPFSIVELKETVQKFIL